MTELPPGPPHWSPPHTVPTSGLATAALVLSLLGTMACFLFGIPSIIAVALGHAAMRQTRTGARGGHGLAVAALIIGYPFAAGWLIFGLSGAQSAMFQ